jgi:hypothetical protein
MPDEHPNPPPERERCPHCGSLDVAAHRLPSGMHYAELICSRCGAWIKWIGKPWSMARARSFTAPYGKYKGKRMDAMPEDYLHFAAREWTGNPGIAAAICAGLRRPDPSGP